MENRHGTDCARCGRTLQRGHRFCPECGLPTSGSPVLSSEIARIRENLESGRAGPGRPQWRRYLLPTSSAVMLTVVLSVGLLLFNRRLVTTLFPPAPDGIDVAVEIGLRWEPQWVPLTAGTYFTGPPFELPESELLAILQEDPRDNVRNHRITNERWLDFLIANEEILRATGRWSQIVPGYGYGWRRDPPLTGRPIMPVDALTGEPLFDALVEDVSAPEVEDYWIWHTSSVEYQIVRLGVTNARWREFLAAQADTLDDATRQAAFPRGGSGWGLDTDGVPGLPQIRVTSDDGSEEIDEDTSGAIEGVSAEAVARFRAWAADAAESDEIRNAHWRAFLLAAGDELRDTPHGDGTLWDAALPPAAAEWLQDDLARPVVPRRTALDADALPAELPDVAGLLAGSDPVARERFRTWVRAAVTGRIENAHWRAFLLIERDALERDGLWASALPGTGTGWGRDSDGTPTLPCHAESDNIGRTVPLLVRVEEEAALVSGVGVAAVRRFHEWDSLREIPYDFAISRYEVRNALWREFLDAAEEGLRDAGIWSEAVPGPKGGWGQDGEGRPVPPAGDLDKPVRNVSARAVREFGRWLTRRLGEPGVEIRMPRPAEWEYAARGSSWRIYPWGDHFLGDPAEGTGDAKTRTGIEENHPLQVDAVDEKVDVTPGTGIAALGVNVSEWVEDFDDLEPDPVTGEIRRVLLGAQIRGASFKSRAENARQDARIWERLTYESRLQRPETGVRLVKWRRRH